MIPNIKSRRRVIKTIGAGGATIFLAGCLGSDDDDTVDDEDTVDDTPEELLHTPQIVNEGAVEVPLFLFSQEQGVWEDHGLDVQVEVAGFSKVVRQVVTELTDIGNISIPATAQFIEEGEDLVFISPQQNLFNSLMTKSGSGIQEIDDLADAHVGVPPETTTTTIAVRSVLANELGFDIMEDPAETTTAFPPVLWSQLIEDEIDACLQFTGFTLRGMADDEIDIIFNPYEFWTEEYGHALPVTDFVSRRDWIENNADHALRFLEAYRDAVEVFSENAEEAIERFGLLGGLETEQEAAMAVQLVEDGIMFPPVDGYDEATAESHHDFLEMIEPFSEFTELPQQDEIFFTRSDLEDLA